MKRRIVTLLLVLSIATISITACGNKIESTAPTETEEETGETTEKTTEAEPTETDPSITTNNTETTHSTSGSSMTEMTAPEIQSEDYLIEEMDPTTMYVIDSVMAKEGPNESDFEDSCYLWKDEAVSVIGVVNSYKGETCTWYRLNTGQFISSEYLSTKQPTAKQPTTPTQPTQSQTQGESPLSDMTDQEIQDALNAAMSGNDSNTGLTTPDGRPFTDTSNQDHGGDFILNPNW